MRSWLPSRVLLPEEKKDPAEPDITGKAILILSYIRYLTTTQIHLNFQIYIYVPIKELKTAAGDRYVYFSLEMASLMKEYRSFCEGELELHEGRELTSEDYIFHRHGENLSMTPSTFTWRFKLILKKHALPLDLNVHSLRHPYVKHTTKKYNSEKQKTQATKIVDLIAWGFCFCIVSYSKRSWTL